MADKRIVDLTNQTTPAVGDLIHSVDVSDTTDAATGTSKKATLQVLSDFFEGLILTAAKIKTALGITTLSGSNTGDMTEATGTEVNTGTNQTKYMSPKSIEDSDYQKSTGSIATLTTPRLINGTSFDGSANIVNNFPEGFLINGKIVPSVASNNLTVAIKGMDGNDPSATNPVYCRIGDTVRSITGALSVTANAGTAWFNSGSTELATKEIDYFVYLGWHATNGIFIMCGRIPYATLSGDFNMADSINEKANIRSIVGMAGTEVVANIGRFAATLSAGAGYTWSVPTFTAANLIQRPIYETRWNTWLPAIAWTAGVAPSSPNANYLMNRYRIRGQEIEVEFYRLYGSAGTTVTAGTITLPFGMNEDGMTDVFPAMAVGVDPLVASRAVGNSGTSPNQISINCASVSLAQIFIKGGYKI